MLYRVFIFTIQGLIIQIFKRLEIWESLTCQKSKKIFELTLSYENERSIANGQRKIAGSLESMHRKTDLLLPSVTSKRGIQI